MRKRILIITICIICVQLTKAQSLEETLSYIKTNLPRLTILKSPAAKYDIDIVDNRGKIKIEYFHLVGISHTLHIQDIKDIKIEFDDYTYGEKIIAFSILTNDQTILYINTRNESKYTNNYTLHFINNNTNLAMVNRLRKAFLHAKKLLEDGDPFR